MTLFDQPAASTEIQAMREALLGLGLPIHPSDADQSVIAAGDWFDTAGIEHVDRAATILAWIESWREGALPRELERLAKAVLQQSGAKYGQQVAPKYFRTHADLMSKQGMSAADSTVLLGYLDLVGQLADEHSMSSAQIADLLRARGAPRGAATWPAVQLLLRSVGLEPKLRPIDLEQQVEEDVESSERTFADARLRESVEFVAGYASSLGLGSPIDLHLSHLVPEGGPTHWPYVFILHFACSPIGWYDHSPAYLYEFNPRGEGAKKIQARYQPLLDAKGSPVLNNAKAVDRLDATWADSKGKLRGPASALVEILTLLDGMPYSAKRRLAELLRQWCVHQLRLSTTPSKTLDRSAFGRTEINRTLENIASAETHTRGVIEQRFVDVIGAALHQDSEWRARGLSDSVNAANFPRRKLGDCEFQDSQAFRVEAYEAHGGTLTPTYLDGHVQSLERVLDRRIEDEWQAFSDPASWSVTVWFVAHELHPDVERLSLVVHDVRVEIVPITYEALLADCEESRHRDEIFRKLLVDLINEPRGPEFARSALADLSDVQALPNSVE